VQVAADFDGNGKTDFMVSEGQTNLFGGDNISFMLNQGGLNFTRQTFSQGGFLAAKALDGNGDGKADVGFTWSACHTPCGGSDVWSLATGAPQQIDTAQWDDSIGLVGNSPVAADFNGDGQRDIAWSYASFATFTSTGLSPAHQAVLIHVGPTTPDPAHQQNVEIDVGPDEGGNVDTMVTADFNNDGAPDMVVASQTHGVIRVMLNTTVGVVHPGFAFGIAPAAATVAAGQSATLSATLTPTGGFTQQVTFSCSGLPAGAACSFTPGAIVPSNGAAKATLTITTTPRKSGALHRGTGGVFFALTLPLLGVVMVGGGKRRAWARIAVLGALCVVLVLVSTSCGGFSGSSSQPPNPPSGGGGGGGTPAGAYTVVVTAQGGGVSHTANVRLTVQ
jgi:hypothetical protein